MHKNIVLVGPMGVGKTTIGKKLARALGKTFVDTDSLVTAEHGEIAEIFSKQGEPAFRSLETQALRKALESDSVVATGGGVVLSAENQSLLRQHWVVYLSTDGKHMASRLSHGNRPLLKNGLDDWRRIYDERRPIYEQLANFEVATAGKSVAQCVLEIKEMIGAL